MHDPLVVAHEIPSPIPRRKRWEDKARIARRWGFARRRRTNAANLGQPTYRWWRPHGWVLYLAGRAYGLRNAITVWHVEPRGRDTFDVCKRGSRWKWHVHHWRIQFHYERRLRRFLLERCVLCGRRFPWGYAPVSHQWDGPRARWRDGVVRRAYHHECSALVHTRQTVKHEEEAIRALVAYLRAVKDCSEEEIVEELTGSHATWAEFHVRYRLQHVLGYERDGAYRLVKKDTVPA